MASGGISENIAIGDLAQTPPPTDYDGDEESFVVLGRSPNSFTFNENSSLLLRDALKSLTDDYVVHLPVVNKQEREEVKMSVAESEQEKKEKEIKADCDNSLEQSLKTCTSSLANLSLQEIQTKVEKMVLENLELKETIQQNNMAMKKQCETILQWQEDVQRVHDSHKAKFEETKRYIEKLQMENLQLKDQLEKSEEKQRVLQEQMRRSSLVEKTSFDNVQQFQLEAAHKKIELLEAILKEKKEGIGRMQGQLQAAERLKQMQLQQLEAYEKEKWQLNEKLRHMEVQLMEERSHVGHLKNELEQGSKKMLEMHNMLSQNRRATSAPPDEQIENVRQQLMNAQMHITELELAKSKFHDTLSDKELEIKRLEKQLSDVKGEKSDEHAALIAQLDVYKTDYEAEASARDSLMVEKNQIAEDLQNLQRRNQQLIEEVERLRRHGDFVHVGDPRRRTSESSSATEARFDCPKCSFKFNDFNALENHVYRCIDLDSLP